MKQGVQKRRTDDDLIIGENVRVARIARSISQTDLGRPLGITFQQIQKHEKGTTALAQAGWWQSPTSCRSR